MRPLVIDAASKARVAEILRYSEKPENWFLPEDRNDGSISIPGDNPEHCFTWNTFRCVFSYTKTVKGVYRHLSVSVPSANYPNPIAAFHIATEFGFSGSNGMNPGPDWIVDINEAEHCMVIVQKLRLAAAGNLLRGKAGGGKQ